MNLDKMIIIEKEGKYNYSVDGKTPLLDIWFEDILDWNDGGYGFARLGETFYKVLPDGTYERTF